MERLKFDLDLIEHYDFLLGIDEVGWGCVAGSLVLGGALVPRYILEQNKFNWLKEVKDSKKLSDKKRDKLINQIKEQNEILFCVGEASVEYINKYGLAQAYTLCINSILKEFSKFLDKSKIIIDGNRDPKTDLIKSFQLIVKGDDKSLTIGIASNIAKDYRDNLMVQLDALYPQYDWKNNVGYGTSSHIKGLQESKISEFHREKATKKLLKIK